ncbi:hypothetical protein BASA81_018473 [Batrachochytrium salamandrivorans]|nr:hypothetical protein BASA81_018473 [Batrachochytrium salamandrivorans]
MGQSVGDAVWCAKCGIISFTGHLAPRLDNPLDIRLHGQLVSRVESYKYLGVLIDSKLDHSAWLKQKRSALEHTISALHPVLANHQQLVISQHWVKSRNGVLKCRPFLLEPC